MGYFVKRDWGKRPYRDINNIPIPERTATRSIISSVIIGLCLALLIVSLWNISHYQAMNIHVFHLNTRQSLQHVTSNRFLSFGLDSSLLRSMRHLPIYSATFIALARYLSPAFVRVGGTSADCLFFIKECKATSEEISFTLEDQDTTNFTLNEADFKALYNFVKKSQLRMIFDINVLIRNSDGSWNDTNARNIISFAKSHNMDIDWQLGNEPNSFHHVFNVTITAEQLAQDYIRLRRLLNREGYDGSLLVGPEVNHIGDINAQGELYAQTFIKNGGNSVDYITWHQYYLNGREAQVEDFINPSTFKYLPMQIKSLKTTIAATNKTIPMWLSETGTAYGGGAPELSDRFVAGFLWLDKLGYSATAGLNVVIRQSLFGGNYAMIGPDLTPNPDWWVSVIYKQFVSERVLTLISRDNLNSTRLYAHCTPEKALINRVPAVTVYGVNVNKAPVRIAFQSLFPVPMKYIKVFFYALTSDDLQSRDIKLNGKVLKLQPNGNLPPFHPIILDSEKTIILPSYSMVFIVIHGVEIPACLY